MEVIRTQRQESRSDEFMHEFIIVLAHPPIYEFLIEMVFAWPSNHPANTCVTLTLATMGDERRRLTIMEYVISIPFIELHAFLRLPLPERERQIYTDTSRTHASYVIVKLLNAWKIDNIYTVWFLFSFSLFHLHFCTILAYFEFFYSLRWNRCSSWNKNFNTRCYDTYSMCLC